MGIELISWAGNVLLVIGLYLIGQKKRSAFIFYGLGCLAWLLYGFFPLQLSLVVIEIIFVVVSIKNFIKWRNDGSTPQQKEIR